MGWFILKHIFSTIFTFITISRLSNLEKDLEILILRQQLSILQRKLNHPIKPNRVEKMALAILTTNFKRISHQSTNQLREVIWIFRPETILRWHRELVRKKWTFPHKNRVGDHQSIRSLKNTTRISSPYEVFVPILKNQKSARERGFDDPGRTWTFNLTIKRQMVPCPYRHIQ